MRSLCAVVALFVAIPAAAANAPRLTFTRVVAAPHGLSPAEHVVVLYVIGDSDRGPLFLDTFLERVNRSEKLRVDSAVDMGHHFIGAHADEATIRRVLREHPADAYLGVNVFTCAEEQRGAEGSEYDSSGERVKRRHIWLDVICSARIDVLSGDGRRRSSFPVHGEGTSPRVMTLGDEERAIARDQAARFAAIDAAEAIAPRTVRESIELDDTAPTFDEGWSMIVADRLDDARAIWQEALRRHRDSAALQFDLAAVCEALGDMKAAGRYYEEAQRRSPADARYRSELILFRKRSGK